MTIQIHDGLDTIYILFKFMMEVHSSIQGLITHLTTFKVSGHSGSELEPAPGLVLGGVGAWLAQVPPCRGRGTSHSTAP